MTVQAARTDIRWRAFGGGPEVVLLHGGMQTSANFTKLARSLATTFTVYVPGRRGRGLSGPAKDGHGLRAEIDDLAAVLDETGARNVFGLSSGAVIALRAAMELPIERLAVYEPPLKHGDHDPLAWLPRYEKELSRGRRASAFVTVVKGTGGHRGDAAAGRGPLPTYLKGVLNGLEPVLPRVRRVTLTGVGYLAADDSGKPELVAAELRKFFR